MKRTERPTPQSWSPVLRYCQPCVQFGVHVNPPLTLVQSALQLLPDGHQLYSRPKIRSNVFTNTERPTTTQDVPSVLPHRLEALLEEVDRLAHLDLVNRRVIVVSPKVLYRLNLCIELFEGGLVVLAIVGLLLLLLLSIIKKNNAC